MNLIVALVSVALILVVLLDAFETLVLPRRVERSFRLAPILYKSFWRLWASVSRRVRPASRDTFLSVFGPFSLLCLLTLWAVAIIAGFAGMLWGFGAAIHAPEETPTPGTYLYLSATTFITLGFGDVAPRSALARILADVEAGLGFGFLAVVIGYLPVLYGAFSRREIEIALLDARASSPPAAGELLRRYAASKVGMDELKPLLRDWERWSAELLESHLSYPVLTYYRSQHDRQSWLGALTVILDTCAFVIAVVPEGPTWQAKMTFAMSRHAAVDLALIFDTPPHPPPTDRLPPEAFAALCDALAQEGQTLAPDIAAAEKRLVKLRGLYEPFVNSLSQTLLLNLPLWTLEKGAIDNWQTSAWDRADHFFQAAGPQETK